MSIFLKAPRSLVRWYDKTYVKYPLTMSGLTLGFKAGGCDIVSQKYSNPDCELDMPRIAKFTCFCVFYVGSFQHVLFNIVYPKIFVGNGFKVAAQMALFDNFVHSPFLYLPTYYSFKSVVEGNSVKDGLSEYYEEGLEVLKACWGVWVPAQLINFWIIPKNFRIAYIAVMGSVWEVVLSYLAPMKSTDSSSSTASSLSLTSSPLISNDHLAGNLDSCPLSPVSLSHTVTKRRHHNVVMSPEDRNKSQHR